MGQDGVAGLVYLSSVRSLLVLGMMMKMGMMWRVKRKGRLEEREETEEKRPVIHSYGSWQLGYEKKATS